MRVRALAGAAALALVLAGCGTGGADDTGTVGQQPGPRTLTVFAAASLTESFTALEKRFEADNAGVDVKLNFAGSSALAQQITNGAEVDVFAAADEGTMRKVEGELAEPARVFVTNWLTIVVPPANPARITGFADLARDGVTLVVCAPQVPCGAAAEKVADTAGVALKPVSEEQDVKAVLTKVRTGDADAGLVYVTDARAAGGDVTAVPFPEADAVINNYPIGVLREAPQGDLAKRFVELVTGEAGRAEFGAAGFGAP